MKIETLFDIVGWGMIGVSIIGIIKDGITYMGNIYFIGLIAGIAMWNSGEICRIRKKEEEDESKN